MSSATAPSGTERRSDPPHVNYTKFNRRLSSGRPYTITDVHERFRRGSWRLLPTMRGRWHCFTEA